MSIKTIFAAFAVAAVATTTAFAQTAQQPTTQNPLRPTTPAAPAAPAAPAVQRPATPAPAAAQPAQPAQARPTVPANQLINVNTASASELETLPQIGPARSKAIIAGRPYRDWNHFVSTNVVPKNAEEAINGKIKFR